MEWQHEESKLQIYLSTINANVTIIVQAAAEKSTAVLEHETKSDTQQQPNSTDEAEISSKTEILIAMNKRNGKRKGGRIAKYPWAEWFAQGTVRCMQGVHFTCMQHTFGVQARQAANRLGISLSVKIDPDGSVTLENKNATTR